MWKIVIFTAGIAIISAEELSRITCDPVGTFTISEKWNHRVPKRCICHPLFHGFRCERIHRCISGISLNISCIDPPNGYRNVVENRCMEGQRDLEVCDCFDGYSGHLCEQVVGMDRHNAKHEKIFQTQMILPKSKEYARKQWLNITEQISQEEEEEEITRKLALKYKLLIIMTIIMTAFACCLIFAYYKMLKLKCDVRVRRILMEELINETERRNHLKRLYMSPPSYFECAALPVESHKLEDLTDDKTTNEHEDEGNIIRITNQNQEVTVVSTEHRLYLHV